MNTEAIRAKFDKWWESTGKTDLVSYTSGFASSNRLTINHREMAFEAYMQAVKSMEAEVSRLRTIEDKAKFLIMANEDPNGNTTGAVNDGFTMLKCSIFPPEVDHE